MFAVQFIGKSSVRLHTNVCFDNCAMCCLVISVLMGCVVVDMP